MKYKVRHPLVRFLSKVEKRRQGKRCWIWQGAVHKTDGYPSFSYLGKKQRAHKVSYMLHVGNIPEGLIVRHTCDNKLCVNPAHLRLGTHAENSQDMVMRGRQGNRKLTWVDVNEIRRIHREDKAGCMKLARWYNVGPTCIQSILNNKSWKRPTVDYI